MYFKFASQVAGAVLAAVLPALAAGNGHLDPSEWVNVAALALGSVMVLSGGELPSGVWSKAKFYISAAVAGVVVVQSALTDGSISNAEWWQVAIAVLSALGVLAAPGPKVVEAARFDALQRGLGDAGLANGPR